jgi:N utilization substance protein B
MGVRRKGREAALRLLYQIDASGDVSVDARERFWEAHGGPDGGRGFAEQLVDAVVGKEVELDTLIGQSLDNWQIGRLARIDLLLLRLSVGELLSDSGTPVEVIIDEAVEIARKYSDPDAPAFINGVLDRVAREHGLIAK